MADTMSYKQKYWIVFVCMFIQAIPFGIAQNIQPLFIPYVVDKFNFSLASFSLIFTFGAVASAVFSPFLGKLFGKINIKVIFLTGTIVSSLSFLAFGLARTLPEFYIYSALSQIGCVFFSGLGVPYVINNWFPNKGRGKALGIAFSGGSIGNIFLQQITSYLLSQKGPSATYIILGIVSLVVSIPTVLLFIRMPKDGEITHDVDQSQEQSNVVETGPTAAQVRKDKYFWMFTIGYAIIAISISALSTQYATFFTNQLKLDPIIIGIIGSVFAASCLLGNVGGGVLFDRLGTFKTMFIAMILEAVSIIAMLLATNNVVFAFVFAICYGLNVYSYMAAPGFMTSDIFGKREASVKLGIVSLIFAIGFAIGSTLFGFLVDTFNFSLAWIVMLVCVIGGYGLLLTAIKRFKHESLS